MVQAFITSLLLLIPVGALAAPAPVTDLPLQIRFDQPLHSGIAVIELQPDPGWYIYDPEPGDIGRPTSIIWPDGVLSKSSSWPAPVSDVDSELGLVSWIHPVSTTVTAPVSPAGLLGTRAKVSGLVCRTECIPFQQTVRLQGTTQTEAPALPLYWLLLYAFAGGLLLNLMPCVLPAIAIKARQFSALQDRKLLLRQSLWYALGIWGSIMVLGFVAMAVRTSGQIAGWGMHFQDPRYLAAMVFVITGFAVTQLRGSHGLTQISARLANSFAHIRWLGPVGDGIVTTLLASPCTAPFLGTAVGVSLTTGSQSEVLAVFASTGAGLALPVVILALLRNRWSGARTPSTPPRWVPWFFALLLALTVAWLVWVMAGVAGSRPATIVTAGALLLGFGLWLRGRTVGSLLLAAWFALALGFVACMQPRTNIDLLFEGTLAKIETARTRDPITFVNITADWCLTCKINEKTVLQTDAMQAWFAANNVQQITIDWTRRDPRIAQFLATYKRAGVPLYVWVSRYGPDATLPELLTTDLVQTSKPNSAD